MSRKVPAELIAKLNAGAENQGKPKGEFVVSYTTAFSDMTFSFDRGHNVQAGEYVARLIDIKCVGVYFYKMEVEVLPDDNKPQIITGFVKRNEHSFKDLADCFSNGVLHKSPDRYIGNLGFISLNEMGDISLIDRADIDRLIKDRDRQ